MPCFQPLDAWKLFDGSVSFVERGDVVRSLQLPCGQCIGCRLERSRQWAVRCVHEAKLHQDNCFITLTYDDDHLPHDGGLHIRDLQLFFKRFRREIAPLKIRFFACGEYGDQRLRPHFHAVVFGFMFPDLVPVARSAGDSLLCTSDVLSRLWPFGFSSVGEFNFQTAAYVARYAMKKVSGKHAETFYRTVDTHTGELFDRRPEFVVMSRKPGIGSGWFDKYGLTDVFPHDRVVINGHPTKPPKFYDKLFSELDPLKFEDIQFAREQRAREQFKDNSQDRLLVKQEVVVARLSQLKRSLK